MNSFLDNLHQTRAQKQELIESVLNRATEETRDVTDIEVANIQALTLEIQKLDERIEQITDIEVRKANAAKLAASVDGDKVETRSAAPARVTSEEPTYHERGEHSFLADAFAAEFGGSYEARERIQRYQNEVRIEKRDSTSSNFAGLVVPQYLVDQFAPMRYAGRPTADISTKVALPPVGMNVNLGRLTTGITSYAATEGTAVSESSPDDTLLTVDVRTVQSMWDISKQASLRGVGVEDQLLGDAIRSYHATLDSQILNGSGTAPNHRGILNTSGIGSVTFTDATPTWAEFFPKLVDAVTAISTNFYGAATHIVAHPSLIGCWLRALDTTNRPIFAPTAGNPMNAAATYGRPDYMGGGLQILGIPVVADANVPTNLGAGTNETAVIVGDFRESYLWEDNGGTPLYVRFEEPSGINGIRTILFGFSAYTAGKYPTAFAKITGTGLITSTWA